jgi:hypothetical protein
MPKETLIPKEVIINVGLRLLVGGTAILATSLIDHALQLHGILTRLVAGGLVSFAITWTAVFFAGLSGFSPNKKDQLNPRNALIATATFCIAIALIAGGWSAAIGSLLGAAGTFVFFRGYFLPKQ